MDGRCVRRIRCRAGHACRLVGVSRRRIGSTGCGISRACAVLRGLCRVLRRIQLRQQLGKAGNHMVGIGKCVRQILKAAQDKRIHRDSRLRAELQQEHAPRLAALVAQRRQHGDTRSRLDPSVCRRAHPIRQNEVKQHACSVHSNGFSAAFYCDVQLVRRLGARRRQRRNPLYTDEIPREVNLPADCPRMCHRPPPPCSRQRPPCGSRRPARRRIGATVYAACPRVPMSSLPP